MFCEKCGASVGENDQFCPECGEKIAGNAVTEPQQETVSTPVQQETVQMPKQPLPQEPVEEKKAKKGMKKMPLIIAACVVVVALIIGFANSSVLANTFKKATASPEEYYQWVEKKQLEEAVEIVGNLYEDYLLQLFKSYDQSADMKLTLSCEEGAKDWLDMLELLVGEDLSWLETVSLDWKHNMKDGVVQETLGVALEKQNLAELTVIADAEKERFYVSIPTLSSKYIGGDMDENYSLRMLNESLLSMSKLENLAKTLPKSAKLEKLLDKYVKLAVSYVDDVKLTKGKTLRADDIKQECTQLKVTFDAKMASEMVEEVFETLAKDEEIEEIIIAVCEALEEMDIEIDADDLYDDFVDACEEIADDAKYIDGDGEIVMYVYVDNAGDVVGREVEVGDVVVTLFAPEDGKKVGYKYSLKEDGTTYFSLEGNGTKSGNKLNGTFSLECDGYDIVELTTKKLDLDSLKKGRMNGTVEARLAGGVSKLLDLYFDEQYSWYDWYYGYDYDYTNDSSYKMTNKILSALKGMVLSLDTSMSEDKSTVTISLCEETGKKTEKIVSLEVVCETGSGKKVSVPSDKNVYDAMDEDDLEDWWDEFDWSGLLKKLDKTSLPSDWIDIIDDISDIDAYDIFRYISYMW